MKGNALILPAVAGLAVAAISAFSALDSTRLVDVIGIFAGGFGAGAAMAAAIVGRKRANQHDGGPA